MQGSEDERQPWSQQEHAEVLEALDCGSQALQLSIRPFRDCTSHPFLSCAIVVLVWP